MVVKVTVQGTVFNRLSRLVGLLGCPIGSWYLARTSQVQDRGRASARARWAWLACCSRKVGPLVV